VTPDNDRTLPAVPLSGEPGTKSRPGGAEASYLVACASSWFVLAEMPKRQAD
jgi:hypothetical protein